MQILEIDWKQFLHYLPAFQLLPREARRFFLEKVPPSQPIDHAELGAHGEALLASGFLVPGGPKNKFAVAPHPRRALARVMGAFHRLRIFDSPSSAAFDRYLDAHFTNNERSAFYRAFGGFYGGLYSRICSVDWLNQFLGTKSAKWEQQYSYGFGQRSFFTDGVLHSTQELVRGLLSRPSPVPLVERGSLCPQLSPDLLAAVLMAGFRYLLLFASLRGEDLEPALSVWPRITARVFRATPRPPEAVTPSQVFHSPFLMDDMASILAACAIEPIRLRRDDGGVFARTEKELASSLGTLPEWVERHFEVTMPDRIDEAISFSRRFEFLTREGGYGEDLRLEVTEAGRNWMSQAAKERLKTLLDGLRGKHKKRSEMFDYDVEPVSLLPYPVSYSYEEQNSAVLNAVLKCFAEARADAFLSWREFLAYHQERGNPLLPAGKIKPQSMLRVHGRYVTASSLDDLEEAWTGLLADVLRLRLLPLAGVKVGLQDNGEICFALTEAGEYLAGMKPAFDFEPAAARVVVQPNFEIVFLAPAPRLESEIARFAERRGRHTGTLFRITKRSIFAAAAAGLTAEQVSEALGQCDGELPPNVQREVSGWLAQCRQITMRPAVLIHCPDADTAARVLTVTGTATTRISPTTLELQQMKKQASLVRTLRENGIFVRSRGV